VSGYDPLLTNKGTGKQEQCHIVPVIIQLSLHAALKSDAAKPINCHISRFLLLICDTLTGSLVPFNEDRSNLAVADVSRRILWKKDIIGLIRDSLDCKWDVPMIL